MSIDNRDYKNLSDYLAHLYQCQPYTRGGIAHPVAVFPPQPWQVEDIDSLLDATVPSPADRDFAFYDYSCLHDLQNSKPSLRNGRTFTMKSLRLKPLRLRGAIGRYFDMLATCAALERELRHALAEGWMRAPSRAVYHRQLPAAEALTSGWGRCATIGISTLTVYNDGNRYRAILARRSAATAIDSGMFHVLPAMNFATTTATLDDAREWRLSQQIYREILEELFAYPEQVQPPRWDYFHDHPALLALLDLLARGGAQLCATGIAFNLLTLRPEVCTLLLIHDPAWHARVSAPGSDIPLAVAEETLAGSVVHAPIDSDAAFLAHFPPDLHLRMPAHGTAALWLGIDMARERIARGAAAAG